MLHIVLLIIGFFILIKGADWLVDGAASIAKRFKVSDLAVGLTVVAFGTSLPELFVNVAASLEGSAELAIGNIVGSNIANILLILGVASVIYPLKVHASTVYNEIPFSLLAVILLYVLGNDKLLDGASTSVLTRTDGIVFFTFFLLFMYYVSSIARRFRGLDEMVPAPTEKIWVTSGQIILGLIGLALGGKWIVENSIWLAHVVGASESLVGLSIVALGTSFPELATSAIAARKHNADIAVGNVVGSNIFNIFFVLGISSSIKPIPVYTFNNVDIGVALAATALLFLTMFLGKKRILERWEGIILLISYAAYLVFLGIRG